MFLVLLAFIPMHFDLHAGVKSAPAVIVPAKPNAPDGFDMLAKPPHGPPIGKPDIPIARNYSYGFGFSITVGRKPKLPNLFDRPTYYNYNLKCPSTSVPTLSRRTTQWICSYY